MSFEQMVGLACGIITILGFTATVAFKIIHKNIMEDVNMLVDKKITDYEHETEKIREERQKRYSDTIDGIKNALLIINANLEKLHVDINSYGTKLVKHDIQIETLEKNVAELKDNQKKRV